ncbi:MAG: hypothetical protein GTO02_02830, partial [Candidatus Dadabacteria bacterium]|nr:hypothetical protein [Candidatus Dadabacteria bacterium]NIQ13365.1 hypothetical protein [Candidatus Dadabacteria bacterium]
MKTKLHILIFILPIFIISGCPVHESLFFDDSMPDFETEAVGKNYETGLSIDLYAYRDYDHVGGHGELLIDDFKFDIEVIDAYLPTDGYYEEPIPQNDNLFLYDYICTPRFAELAVKLTPGNYITTIKLNECEAHNSHKYDDGYYVYNPCNGYVVLNFNQFNGRCLEDERIGVFYGDDTIQIEEFGDFCGPDVDRCLIPDDVFIDVPSLEHGFNFYKETNK